MSIIIPIDKLFLLIAGHFLADFPLQGEHIARTKNRHSKPDYIPTGQKPTPIWFYSLGAHGFIHGLVVYMVTGSLLLGLAETLGHFIIDFLKCDNVLNPHQDQALHLLMKALYSLYL